MFANPSASWYHGGLQNPKSACEHCGGTARHEKWCITCDPVVQYAHGIVQNPEWLTVFDALILHALGVAWRNEAGAESCATS